MPARRQTMILYHGSPHQFDAFCSSAIGRGQGFQTYGHGLYFAESRRVADSYRKELQTGGEDHFFFGGRLLVPGSPQRKAAAEIFYAGRRDALSFLRQCVRDEKAGKMTDRGHGPQHWQTAYEFAQSLRRGEIRRIRGVIYTVAVAAAATAFLDWDKPLRWQSKAVLRHFDADGPLALREKEIRPGVPGYLVGRGPLADDKELIVTGAQLYRRAAERMGGRESGGWQAASDYFASLGVAGVRYLDGDSRQKVRWRTPECETLYGAHTLTRLMERLESSALGLEGTVDAMRRDGYFYDEDVLNALDRGDLQGNGTCNYVVFDESIINITHRNDVPVAARESRAALVEMKAQDQALLTADQSPAASLSSRSAAETYLPASAPVVEPVHAGEAATL